MDERLVYRYTQTDTVCTHTRTYAHSCSKNKDKSMFDAPNPGSEGRREWEDRNRERVAERNREKGRGD